MSKYDEMDEFQLVLATLQERLERIEERLELTDLVPAEVEFGRRMEARR